MKVMGANIGTALVMKACKALKLDWVPEETIAFLVEKADAKIAEESEDREAFAKNIAEMSDEELKATYVPTVYQKDIYNIDYAKLRESGITFLSFDIDDTISDSFLNKGTHLVPGMPIPLPKKAKKLFKSLKEMGFTVTLLTNAKESMAKAVCKELDADGYIGRAEKPETKNFEKLQQRYGVEKSQMAHIGNSMRQDVVGGNKFGITTCLVRRAGKSWKVIKFVMKTIDMPTKGHLVREELKRRSIWRKHHQNDKGDQYYQLGEIPKYQCT